MTTNWSEDMKYNPGTLLRIRNMVEELVCSHKDIKWDGSAGVGVNGADFDVTIEGERYNIRIQPL